MTRIFALLAVPLLLVACASPQQRCLMDATRELRTVDNLIAETEANLARGYAIDRELDQRSRLTFCTGSYGHWGYGAGMSFCTTDDIVYRDRPVAIDPAAEQRKLSLLRDRRARLAPVAQRAVTACRAS